MSETFAARAAALAGLAARVLGWRPQEFWSATPAELTLSLAEPVDGNAAPPSRADIERLIEKDKHNG